MRYFPTIVVLACLWAILFLSPAFAAAAPPTLLRGTPCATGTAGTGNIGQTVMDTDQVDLVACLYTDPAHNTPPNPGIWRSMFYGTLGSSSTNTSPSVAGDPTTGLFTPGPGQVAISSGGSERFVVDQSGNVGIGTGTNSVVSPLEVTSSNPIIGSMGFGTYWGDMWFDGGSDGYFPFVNTSPLNSGGTSFVRNPNFSGNIIPLFYIGNNGSVGVGTETPKATLDVNGYARLSLNSSEPATCRAHNAGAIALNHTARICTCNGTQWIDVTGAACTW
jgi:hypothetical protein